MTNRSQQTVPETRISTVVGPHPFFSELRGQPVIQDGVKLDFNDSYSPTHKAFRSMVEDQAFDVCEMAIATYVQARAAGKPIALLPITVIGRFQHLQLVYDATRSRKTPKELEGGRVGVRSYSQTTGLWVRSLLHSQFNVDLSAIEWIVVEEPHVRGFNVPANVTMATPGTNLHELLERGDLDAVIGAYKSDRVEPLIESPGQRAKEWYEHRRIVSVNHVLTVREALFDQHPDTVRDLYRTFKRAVDGRPRTVSEAFKGPDWEWSREVETLPTGYAQMLPILRLVAEEAFSQELIPEPVDVGALIRPEIQTWD